MKQVAGIWLTDQEEELVPYLQAGPMVDGRGTYQHRKYARALQHVKRRGHAVDVGAQVGTWSRLMALDFQRVTAFEPMPAHVECFRKNLAGAANVTLHETALGSEAGQLRFHMRPEHTGNTHVAADGEVTVRARTLDSFGLTDIDFLKIDVEGFETHIVRGGEATIRREKPVIIIEQKPSLAEKQGFGRFDAIEQLNAWGGRVAWEIGGDFLVEWP